MDVVQVVASKTGLDPSMVKAGLGIVLGLVKKQQPELYTKIAGFVPGADALAGGADLGGGMLGAVGNLLGGGKVAAAGEAADAFGKAGFSAEQVGQFLPGLMGALEGKVPADALAQLGGLLPGGGDVPAST